MAADSHAARLACSVTDQMLLGLEDVEQSLAGDDAAKPMTPAERSARASILYHFA
jgi:hypothetical protein